MFVFKVENTYQKRGQSSIVRSIPIESDAAPCPSWSSHEQIW